VARTLLSALVVILCLADLAARVGWDPQAAWSQSAPFQRFSGQWYTHGGGLHIGPNGKGYYTLRAYVQCNARYLTACDNVISKNGTVEIYNGRFATFTLTRIVGNTMRGTITNASNSWLFNTPISFTYTTNKTLRMMTITGSGQPFCSPDITYASPSPCGA